MECEVASLPKGERGALESVCAPILRQTARYLAVYIRFNGQPDTAKKVACRNCSVEVRSRSPVLL